MTGDIKNKIYEMKSRGMGYRKIASELDLPLNTIKSFLQRAEKKRAGVCKECGKEITSIPHKKQKLFCSDSCRTQWWTKHRQERTLKATYKYICPVCKKEFIAYGNPNRRYCSRACSAIGRSKQNG